MLAAIQLMVRQNLSLRQAAQQLGVDLTPQQADNNAKQEEQQAGEATEHAPAKAN